MESFNHQRSALNQSLRILVVEDDDLDFQIITRSLKKSLPNGCSVIRASTVSVGKILLEAEKFDVALVDNNIGPDSGIEFIRMSAPIHDSLPFVMMTGEVSGGIDLKALEAGADDFLDKGDLTPELLRRTIRYSIAHRRSLVSLQQTNEELERFAYVASHDLQEPLRKIAYYSDRVLTELGSEIGERPHKHLQSVNKAATRMRSLISDLLSYSKINSLESKFEAIDVPELLSEVEDILSASIEKNSAKITITGEQKMFADKFLMRQLLQNLIANSIRYRDVNTPEIELNLCHENSKYCLCVSDNGMGFEAKYADKIFRAFERLHRKEEIQGTGIGLSICEKIARRHGGKIWAESEPGKGAKFFLEWPDVISGLSSNDLPSEAQRQSS